MADEKWIAGLHGDMPVTEAAQKVLALRLGTVRDRLPAAVFHADDDIENVHQLRVGTRRAAAALRIFVDCLPDRLARKTRRALRELRQSAGEARDWDVFLEMLQTRSAKAPARQRRGLDLLLGFAHGQRMQAQQYLVTAYEESAERFAQRVDEVAQAFEKPDTAAGSLSELAVPLLTELLREFDTAARSDLQEYEALHQVRILGKQLRYAMEIFESCFAPEFRHRYYPVVVEMQDILGVANDSSVACQRLNSLRSRLMHTNAKQWAQYQAGIEALIRFHERRLPEQRRKFEKWWQAWLDSGAEEAFAKMVHGQ